MHNTLSFSQIFQIELHVVLPILIKTFENDFFLSATACVFISFRKTLIAPIMFYGTLDCHNGRKLFVQQSLLKRRQSLVEQSWRYDICRGTEISCHKENVDLKRAIQIDSDCSRCS